MLIWTNTTILNSCNNGLSFTKEKNKAKIALIGSQSIDIDQFPNIIGIFRAGIGYDNVPNNEAREKGIIVRFPSKETTNIIFQETACFTCSLIFRMLYDNPGSISQWAKAPRHQMINKTLLIIGRGNIGSRVAQMMKPFIKITTFDIVENKPMELKNLLSNADCLTIHIPKNDQNTSFIDEEKLSWLKNGTVLINTARGSIVDEDALYKELKNKRLKAAFDVFWQEPYRGKLTEFYPDRFYITPHVASTCNEFLHACRAELDNFIIELSD